MKEKRDDFGWLVSLLEEKKRYQNVRPMHMYTHQEQISVEFRKRKKRKELMSIMYLLIFALGVSLLFILH